MASVRTARSEAPQQKQPLACTDAPVRGRGARGAVPAGRRRHTGPASCAAEAGRLSTSQQSACASRYKLQRLGRNRSSASSKAASPDASVKASCDNTNFPSRVVRTSSSTQSTPIRREFSIAVKRVVRPAAAMGDHLNRRDGQERHQQSPASHGRLPGISRRIPKLLS